MEKLHSCRAPSEDVLAQKGVKVDPSEPGLLLAQSRRLAGFVVCYDKFALLIQLQPVDDPT